jgi:hypothetical protein
MAPTVCRILRVRMRRNTRGFEEGCGCPRGVQEAQMDTWLGDLEGVWI